VAIRLDDLERARKTQSLAGGLCQLSGSLLAVIAGAITIGTVANGGGLSSLLFGGSASFALALAGAPLAALGSIANSQKASKELLLLYVRENAAKPPRRPASEDQRRWAHEAESEEIDYIEAAKPDSQQINRQGAGMPPLPPPPPPPIA